MQSIYDVLPFLLRAGSPAAMSNLFASDPAAAPQAQPQPAAPSPFGALTPAPQQAAPAPQPSPMPPGMPAGVTMPSSVPMPSLDLGAPMMGFGGRPSGLADIKPAAPAMAAKPADDDEDGDKPAPASKPAMGFGLPGPAAPAAGASQQSPGVMDTVSKAIDNLYGNGGGGDFLINLGIGLMSGKGIGDGLKTGLQLTQQQKQSQLNNELQQGQLALQRQKLQRDQQALIGNTAFVKSAFEAQGKPVPADATAAALASNPSVIASLVASSTRDDDKQVTTVTDPAERAKYIRPQDDHGQLIQVDANGKVTLPGSGGVSVNLGDSSNKELNGKVIDTLDEGRKSAVAASSTLQNINHMAELLDSGQLITGTGSNQLQTIRGAIAQALGIQDPGLQKTQEFISQANAKAASIARGISGAGHTTNADLDMSKIISGADTTNAAGALRQIMQWQQQAAQQQIARQNADVDTFSKTQPDSADRAGFFRVQMPDLYNFGAAAAPKRLRFDPATGAIQ